MKLEFDSLADLNHFLHWAEKYGGQDRAATPAITNIAVTGLAFPQLDDVTILDTGTGAGAGGESFATSIAPSPLSPTAGDTKPADSPEPAKRKRRTKAEIEADETAAAEAAAAELAKAQQTGQVQPESGTTSPTGANPFDQPSTLQDVGAEGQAATDASSESDVVTPFQHLTRAREFIAKHGMPKYNESFAKAGLDANVMGYTAYQRGVHMSALDELEKF